MHLKSGCNSRRSPRDRDRPVQFDQFPILENWIDARAERGETFAVLGDWNHRLAARADSLYAEIDDADLCGANLIPAADDRPATCKSRNREFIDHIVLGARAARLLVSRSFEEYPMAAYPRIAIPPSIVRSR